MTGQSLLHGAATGGPGEASRATMARVAAVLWTTGGLLSLLGLAIAPDDVDVALAVGTAVLAAGFAAAFRLGGRRLPVWAFHAGSATSTVAIAAALHAHEGVDAGIELLFLWAVLYPFYFYGWRAAAAHAGLMAVAYAVALEASDGRAGGPVEWAVTVVTLLTAGVVVGLLRDRVGTLVARLQSAAVTDPLTGLLNRRGFDELIERELERARRHGRGLALIVGDLDRFKAINDAFGHLAGDTALERVAALVTDTVRRADTTARLGGEELAVVVPEADAHGGYALAERLREELDAAFSGDLVRLTISFGVAAYPRDGATADELLLAADRALYLAKALGRNRTAIHSEDTAALLAELTRDEDDEPAG